MAFLERALPRAAISRVLDLCCGPGRHALPLAERGYDVTGVDRDAAALGAARRAAGLRMLGAYAEFDEAQPASGITPRMQVVFERAG
ncbi:MAG TPA: methyltransferase domain-containing protein [Gemmatimonadaceae bacterium]|nr:methyltransferase domain-containing protein [Gemmatimonadaceae bacterium]